MMVIALLLLTYSDFRGIWVPRWSLADNNKIFMNLEGKFNHIFLQVFALGEAYYPSSYAPNKRTSDKWLRDFLDEAHRRNIRVSAWVNMYYFWGYGPVSSNRMHPIVSKPGWFVVDRNLRSILDYSIDELKDLGSEGYYLSPANPEVQDYLIRVLEELIDKYDFDGIHLDYIRYPNAGFIYDTALRTKFLRKYYFDPMELQQSAELQSRLSLWGLEDLTSHRDEFICRDLSDFIKAVSKAIKSKRSDVYISAAVKPDYSAARHEFYQDWLDWLNSNYLDFVCLMAYSNNIENYLNKVGEVVNDPQRVMIGLGLYNHKPETIGRQVVFVDKTPFGGTVFFSYEELKKNRAYLNTINKPLLP